MDSRSALVDVEPHNPGDQIGEGLIDFGRLVEALIFYDIVYLVAPKPAAFASLCRRLLKDGDFSTFLSLLRYREIVMVDYDWGSCLQSTGPGSTSVKVVHLITPASKAGKTFEQMSLGAPELQTLLSGSQRVKLGRAALNNLFLIRLGSNGRLLANDAERDYADPDTVSAILFELAAASGVAVPGGRLVSGIKKDEQGFIKVDWNVDFDQLTREVKQMSPSPEAAIRPTDPLGKAIQRDLLLWSAKVAGTDLYLPRPLDRFATEKLRAAGDSLKTVDEVITPIVKDAEFPNIGGDANLGLIKLSDAIRFRDKAKRFRVWLHSERTHDRDAVRAYLGEFQSEAGLRSVVGKVLTIAGAVGGAAIGAAIADNPKIGAVAGAAIGGAADTLLSSLAEALRGPWRPMVFGSWVQRQLKTPRS